MAVQQTGSIKKTAPPTHIYSDSGVRVEDWIPWGNPGHLTKPHYFTKLVFLCIFTFSPVFGMFFVKLLMLNTCHMMQYFDFEPLIKKRSIKKKNCISFVGHLGCLGLKPWWVQGVGRSLNTLGNSAYIVLTEPYPYLWESCTYGNRVQQVRALVTQKITMDHPCSSLAEN